MRIQSLTTFSLACALAAGSASAAPTQREEMLELKNTVVNLVDALVANKLLTPEQAETMKQEALAKARTQAQAEAAAEAPAGAQPQPGEQVAAAPDAVDNAGKKVLRVPYVPEFVKDDIRQQVKAELRQQVHDDVVATAKAEQWGTAKALPAWVNKLSFSGDIRLRHEGVFYGDENIPGAYVNFAAINAAKSVSVPDQGAFYNFTEDRQRERMQMRLGVEAKPFDSLKVGLRIVTGNETDPVSLNQTLGQNFGRYRLALDLGYLRWAHSDDQQREDFVFTGGRMQRPFFSTNLVWDDDVTFEGVAFSFNHALALEDSLFGEQFPRDHLNLTLGVFPLSDNELAKPDDSTNDKWLGGAQITFTHLFENQSNLKLGAAFYDYLDIRGKVNRSTSPTNRDTDWTAPSVMQKGNTLFPIRYDLTTGFPAVYGLVSDYRLFDLTAQTVLSLFAPYQVTLTGDYVKNVGFIKRDVQHRAGTFVSNRTDAWQLGFDVGWPQMGKFGDWNVFANYRYIGADAVLDAYTDSDFHLGGTNAKGWVLGGRYGLAKDFWLQMRYLSADSVDGPPLAIDTLQVDLNAKF